MNLQCTDIGDLNSIQWIDSQAAIPGLAVYYYGAQPARPCVSHDA